MFNKHICWYRFRQICCGIAADHDEEENARQFAAEAKRIADEEENARQLAVEAKRVADEEENARQLAAEAKRITDEEEKARQIATEAKRITDEEEKARQLAAEAKRIADEEEKARQLAVEAKRVADEEILFVCKNIFKDMETHRKIEQIFKNLSKEENEFLVYESFSGIHPNKRDSIKIREDLSDAPLCMCQLFGDWPQSQQIRSSW